MLSDPKLRWNVILASSVVILGIAADQITKIMAASYLDFGKPVCVIRDLLNLNLVKNRGAAFGIGSSWSSFWQNFFFLGVSSIAVLLIIFFLTKNIKGHKMLIVSISLILSGAIGNVYDRIRLKHVVDFLELHYKNYYWPNFNLADTIICIGVGLYLIYSFRFDEKSSDQINKA